MKLSGVSPSLEQLAFEVSSQGDNFKTTYVVDFRVILFYIMYTVDPVAQSV